MKRFDTVEALIEHAGKWQRPLVEQLRAAIDEGGAFEEQIKWGNLVFASGGLAILIRVEETRALIGFWRGKRLRALEPRIKASGI